MLGWDQFQRRHRRLSNTYPEALSDFPLPCGSKSNSSSLKSCHILLGLRYCRLGEISGMASFSTTQTYDVLRYFSFLSCIPSHGVLLCVPLGVLSFGSPETMPNSRLSVFLLSSLNRVVAPHPLGQINQRSFVAFASYLALIKWLDVSIA